MAFQAPNVGQEHQNRKLLEELKEKKRMLMQTQAPPSASSNIPSQSQPSQQVMPTPPEFQHMTPAQRAALQHAHANSVGYFITQDSSFGNLILPVLPRF